MSAAHYWLIVKVIGWYTNRSFSQTVIHSCYKSFFLCIEKHDIPKDVIILTYKGALHVCQAFVFVSLSVLQVTKLWDNLTPLVWLLLSVQNLKRKNWGVLVQPPLRCSLDCNDFISYNLQYFLTFLFFVCAGGGW